MRGFPGGSDGKESACNAGDLGSIPGSGRSPGEGNGYPLLYSYLENSMDRRAWWASPWDHKESGMTEQLTLYGMRRQSGWILLHAAVRFSPTSFTEGDVFSLCIFLPALSMINWCRFISGLSILFH